MVNRSVLVVSLSGATLLGLIALGSSASAQRDALGLASSLELSSANGHAARSPSEPSVNVIPMGETDVKSGTTKIGEVDPAAISTAGPDAAGKVCNKVAAGVSIDGLTFSIKNGSAATLEIEGAGTTTFNSSDHTAHVDLNPVQGGNVCRGYRIKGLLGDARGDNLILSVTPSFVQAVNAVDVECNALPTYELDSLSDQARKGVVAYHADVLAFVHNVDDSMKLKAIKGTVSTANASTATLTDVRIFTSGGGTMPASISFKGATFTISPISGLANGEWCRVLMRCEPALQGKRFQASLTAEFAP
ncbi:MAG: hypothetical protein FJ298_01655 [Planctomycetes bacterium]|nr:hypothetical protein [Planctomycetota bacterium]